MNEEYEFAGEQLRLARLAHGYSLEALGELVGATRQYLHLLETGARNPAPDLILALSHVLGVNPSFFAVPLASTVRPEHCHFRGHISRPASVTSQVLARGTLLDHLVAKFETEVQLPQVTFPEFSIASNEDIEAAAEKSRDFWRLGQNGPIISMMRVVENAGAIVTYFGDLSERVDAFSMDRRRPIVVRSSLKESLSRQRFDLAHEIAHLVMHRGIQTGDRETENQAHRFAGAFLFPRRAFLQEFPRAARINWQGLYHLKLRWKMSVRAIIRRAYDLEIISPVQYRTANIHLVKSGQARVERYDDDSKMPVEQPELLPAAIEYLDGHIVGGALGIATRAGYWKSMAELILGQTLTDFSPRFDDPKVVSILNRRASK